MTFSIRPAILCAGTCSRLLPLSRSGFFKQFLILSGTTSLFQQEVDRADRYVAGEISVAETLDITNEEHRFPVLDQLRELKWVKASPLLKPVGRNKAPELTLASLQATADGRDPICHA